MTLFLSMVEVSKMIIKNLGFSEMAGINSLEKTFGSKSAKTSNAQNILNDEL